MRTIENIKEVDFNWEYAGQNLVTVVCIDSELPSINKAAAGLLMVGWANSVALEKTIETRQATFWSRSREKLWTKGEESGNIMEIRAIYVDCDRDTVVYDVKAPQATCHTGSFSCFELPSVGEYK